MEDTLVLCYHAVSEDWTADLSVTPDALEKQLTTLVERGYRGVAFRDAVAGVDGRAVAVTFDDAPRSVHRIALPIMEELGLVGTVFVPTAHVGSDEPMAWPGVDRWLGGPHEEELLCMSVEQLADLLERGWEVGSHTHTHPHLTELDHAALSGELERSRALLEGWLGECVTLAYPYGDVSPAVAAAARSAGYLAAATLDASLKPVDPLLWPRVGVYHGDRRWRFRLKAAPTVRRLGAGRLRHPLRATRARSRLSDPAGRASASASPPSGR